VHRCGPNAERPQRAIQVFVRRLLRLARCTRIRERHQKAVIRSRDLESWVIAIVIECAQRGPQHGLRVLRRERCRLDSNLPVLGGTWGRDAVTGIVTDNTYVVYPAKTNAYWMVNLDARVSLEFLGLNQKNYLQLNVYNLFDKLYVGNYTSGLNQGSVIGAGQIGGNPGSPPFAQIGAPRTVSGTLSFGF
jgi:hypothetical protein